MTGAMFDKKDFNEMIKGYAICFLAVLIGVGGGWLVT